MDALATRQFPHVSAGAGETYDIVGERLTFKVTQADTAGAYILVELWAQPSGGVPLHTHPSAESFTVLEGEMEFAGLANGQPYTIRATSGDTVFIPGGDHHGYRAVGNAPARALVVLTPGDEMERFFTEAGTRVTDGQPTGSAPADFAALLAIAAKHGLDFLPPPEA